MSKIRYILAGNFIDGSGADRRRKIFLEVKDTLVTAIGSAVDLPGSDGAAIDDFSYCTVVPALIDCSVSLTQSPAADRRSDSIDNKAGMAKKAAMLERHMHYCHIHGVLGAAASDDLEDLQEHDLQVRAPENIIAIRTSGRLCRNIKDCPAAGPAGSDFLKVDYSGNIEEEKPPDPGFNYEDLRLILQLRGGKKAVVVANGRQEVAEALEAGCDAIEQGYAMGEDNLRKMAARNVLWIPSVLRARNRLDDAGSSGDVCCRFSTRYIAPGKPVPGAETFWKKMLAEQLSQLRLARKLGVTTAVGTGAGSIGILHGESMVEEMKLFIKAGYSLEETIQCASENGAKFFGMEKLGTLGVGRPATFLICRGMAQQLPRKLSYLEGIYVDGSPSPVYQK